jgi:hypothetical protein
MNNYTQPEIIIKFNFNSHQWYEMNEHKTLLNVQQNNDGGDGKEWLSEHNFQPIGRRLFSHS